MAGLRSMLYSELKDIRDKIYNLYDANKRVFSFDKPVVTVQWARSNTSKLDDMVAEARSIYEDMVDEKKAHDKRVRNARLARRRELYATKHKESMAIRAKAKEEREEKKRIIAEERAKNARIRAQKKRQTKRINLARKQMRKFVANAKKEYISALNMNKKIDAAMEKLASKMKFNPSAAVEVIYIVCSNTIDTNAHQIYDMNENLVESDNANLTYFTWNCEHMLEPGDIRVHMVLGKLKGASLLRILNSDEANIYEHVDNFMLSIGITPFEVNALLQIKVRGTYGGSLKEQTPEDVARIKSLEKVEHMNGDFLKECTDINNVKRFYLVFCNDVKPLPYENYDINDGECGNCVYRYVHERYPKISGASRQFDSPSGVSLEAIEKFFDKYKIPCVLLNIAGNVIYKNNFEANKSYKKFTGIISCHHLYPIKEGYKSYKPKLVTNIYEDDGKLDNNIIYEKGKNKYTHKGIYVKPGEKERNLDVEIDNEFFNRLSTTFTYKSESKCAQIKALIYLDDKIGGCKYEYDMIKAYATVAHMLTDEYPIFTFFDIYQKYDMSDIVSVYYYCLDEVTTESLREYGIYSSIQNGFVVKFLLDNELICKEGISHVKKCSYTANWSYISNKLGKMNAEGVANFPVYNGLLGRLKNTKTEKYTHLHGVDGVLLNIGVKDGNPWEIIEFGTPDTNDIDGCYWNDDNPEKKTIYDEYGDFVFSRVSEVFRYLNTTTIYNHIIGHCNLVMLENILYIKKSTGAMPVKIKVDAIGYESEQRLMPRYRSIYRLVTNLTHRKKHATVVNADMLSVRDKKICKLHYKKSSEWHNIDEVNAGIMEELSKMDNISFFGLAGTGKTEHIIRNINYDACTTYTNRCKFNLTRDGKPIPETLYSTMGMYDQSTMYKAFRKLANKTLWVDEFSMIDRYTWNFLAILCMKYNTKLVITGDIHQIPPIAEEKIDMSSMVAEKLFGTVTTLTKQWRYDETMTGLCDDVLAGDISNVVFDAPSSYLQYKRHLAYTNRACAIVNNTVLKHNNYTFEFSADGSSLEASIGVILSCRVTRKNNGILKRDLWEISSKSDKGYTLTNLFSGEIKDFKMRKMKYFDLGFCTTVHSTQGSTIDDDICIHEVKKMKRIEGMLYTAMTRCRNIKQLHFYDDFRGGSTEPTSNCYTLPKISECSFQEQELEYEGNQLYFNESDFTKCEYKVQEAANIIDYVLEACTKSEQDALKEKYKKEDSSIMYVNTGSNIDDKIKMAVESMHTAERMRTPQICIYVGGTDTTPTVNISSPLLENPTKYYKKEQDDITHSSMVKEYIERNPKKQDAVDIMDYVPK